MKLRRAHIVLVDISGYTEFIRLHRMSVIHAERIITELLECVIDASSHPLILNKLEGDAALFYAFAEDPETPMANGSEPAAQAVLAQVRGFFDAFRRRERELVSECTLCLCDACTKAGELRIKVIVHTGMILVKQVRQFEEIAGEDVILAHRLLKNSVPSEEYLLLTEAFLKASGPPDGMEMKARTEDCGGHGRIRIHVHVPEPEPAGSGTALPPASLWGRVRTTLKLEGYLVKRLFGFPGREFHHLPVKPPDNSVVQD